jgi:hypothetical protein
MVTLTMGMAAMIDVKYRFHIIAQAITAEVFQVNAYLRPKLP